MNVVGNRRKHDFTRAIHKKVKAEQERYLYWSESAINIGLELKAEREARIEDLEEIFNYHTQAMTDANDILGDIQSKLNSIQKDK